MASAMSEDMKIAGELNRMVQKEVETMFDRMEGYALGCQHPLLYHRS